MSIQGMSIQGMSIQGMSIQGMSIQGMSIQGMSIQGMSIQGMSIQGMSIQGMSIQGMSIQGMSIQGMSIQGMSIQGMSIQGSQLRGIDRERGLAGPMEFRGLSYVGRTSPGTALQGVQGASAVAIDGTQPGTPPQLQLGPSATGAGSYIKANVPGMSGAENELQGTFWNMLIADSTGQGAIGLYVADVTKDVTTNVSKYSANDDVYLYTVYYRHPATAQWISMCPYDERTGKASAMAMPLNPGDWSSTASRQKFGFACTATGVGSKCARNWGYKPWKTVNETIWTGSGFAAKAIPLQPFYDACLISARADYCQDGQSYTKNGTLVDLFDTLDGLTSINPTAGLPYAPNALGPMMHEEYQISALDLMALPSAIKPQYAVSPSDPILASMSAEDRAALLGLRRSGLQSSRYADLDPGRTCLASGYIDRCDPTETYGCYRDDNMSANPYGAMIAVNSPRHCDHNEVNDGAPLDPLCNACVARVCSVDPTCCGDAGNTFFPGSLVWDQRCSAIRTKVCKSGASDAVWRAADVAPVAGTGKSVGSLRGATGALDGIVMQAGIPYLEGWACDPDFPGASSTVQVSVGGLIGAAGTRLVTARADLGIADLGGRADVAAECGTGRHAFRVPLLATDLGKTVYAYGIDLNTPGAPFSILRGGQKTIPITPLAAPRAAIWTGWVEASASGQHTFSVTAGPNDAYRVWVNGQFVATAKWPDPDTTSPAGFVAPPVAPSMFLQKSVRYGVRVEYLRSSTTDSSSTFALRWLPPGGAAADVPTSALHSTNPGTGNGLLGSYFQGGFTSPLHSQTYGAVDYVWTTANPPGTIPTKAGLSFASPFAARFEGQVVPPVSGTYTFTADTDGSVAIWVNGKAVTTANQKPAGTPDPATCAHDICRTGGPIDRACSQGYFCAAQICAGDSYCCANTWDPACLQKVSKICNIDCRQTQPSEITLLAGVKYDIKVELLHDATQFGAKLRLYWALDGGARDTIPAHRLFATPTPAPAASGYGLNGAYFSDVFQTQVLDHADLKASFSTGALPRVDRPTSSVCAYAGGPACTSDVIGPPSLTTPLQGQAILAQSLVFKGVGAVSNATVTVTAKNKVTGAVSTATGPANALGAFTTTALALPTGKYTATASQPGSAASPPVDFDFTLGDPTLPVSPVVTVPQGGIVATTGNTTIGGTATPGAKVTVTVTSKTVPPTTTTYANISTNATTGAWTLAIALSAPGGYTISSTQLVNGSTSVASAPVDAEFAIPAVVVTTPAENASFTTGTVTVTGTAKPGLGKIIVADGDERYFVERQTIDVGSDGKFPPTGVTPVPLALDAGRHVLKIFQRLTNSNGTTNLDGEPVLRHVVMTPAAGANLTIDCAALGTSISNDVALLKGSGAPTRTGLRYSVNIYQGTTKVATTKVEDNGTFTVSNVHLTGVGPQTLKVSLIASSLSGGGGAESLPSTKVCTPSIKPPPPVIVQPVSATTQLATFPISGTGITDALVNILVDGTTKVTGLRVVNGAWSSTLTVTNGSHRIQATQTLGVPSDPSTSVIVMVGDVLPPMVTVTKPDLLTQLATDPKGLSFDFVTVAGVVATDNGVSLPVTCVPATNTLFPLGTTYVTCSAKDATGNVGTTSFKVVIKSKALPVVTGSTVTAEATGPYGAAVSYQVGATGFVANCGPNSTIVACSRWQLATTGLAFTPTNVAIDPRDGTLYASQQVDPTNTAAATTRMVTGTPGGVWRELPFPGPELRHQKISVAPTTSKSTVYIPTLSGLYAYVVDSPTSKLVLPGVRVRGTSVDPNDPRHVFAWNDVPDGGGPAALFETTDGGTSWTLASDGLPTENVPSDSWANYPHITDVAFDRLHPGRIYATMEPLSYRDTETPDRVFRRVGKTAWERLALPPLPSGPRSRGEELGLGVAPTAPAGQEYPSVFVGSFVSTTGGETWTAPLGLAEAFTSLAFDPQVAGTVYALVSRAVVSTDYGKSWKTLAVPSHEYRAILQDPVQRVAGQARTLYLSSRLMAMTSGNGNSTAHSTGLYKGPDGGASWTPVDGPDIAGQLRGVQDMAFDPFDFRIAYLFARSGIFRTSTNGDAWTLRTAGIAPVNGDAVITRNKIAIDPFNRQFLYVSGAVQPGPDAFVNALFSPDGATNWGPKPIPGLLAADPGMKDVFFSSPRFYGEEGAGVSGLVYLNSGASSQTYALDINPLAIPHALDVLPDAARTVVVSYHWFDDTVSPTVTEGGIALFSAKTAQFSTVTPVRTAATGRPSRGPVFDNSDGQNSLFLSGDARGQSPDLLFKASVENLSWTALSGGQPGIDFRRLVIDRGGGGQLMYTVGSDDSFWESQDAGKTWAEDTSAPSYIYKAWTSIDGTLYAAVSDTQTTTEDLEDLAVDRGPVRTAAIWRRGLDTTLPAGARIMQGPLHVNCLGADQGRSVAPGSVFPITPAGSPTVLTCTATDVFGNVGTTTVSIAVSDTLPPNITVTPPTATTTSTDPNVLVPVTISARALDAVDGDVAMTCTAPGIAGSFTPAQGASFKLGVTIVTCTAKDKLNHAATASFPVTVTKSGTSITAPTLTVPGPTTIEATGPTGGTSTFAVSAKKSTGTALTPTCTPALSSTFLLNKTTTVSCSITDSGYTVTKTFDVTCVDRTPPAITVPAPGPTVSAQGPWGATVSYTATKTDKVDGGPVATPCSPATGAIFPIGTTPVVCRAVDKAGNSSTKTFNVVVSDLSPPKVTVPAVIEAEPQDNLGARVTYTGVSATDAQDGARPVDCAPLSGSWFPLGESRVSCQATDLAGNTGRATFIVRVVDKTAPTVRVPTTMVVEASSAAGGKATFVSSAFDTVSGALPTTCTRRVGVGLPAPVVSNSTVLPLGDTVVTCSAVDTAGNTGSASFLVIVRDTTGPVLTLPATTYGAADSAGTAVVTFVAKATDFGVDVPVVCTPSSGTRFLFGTTPVSCVARDSRGNATSGTFNVVVRDTTAPVITNVPATKVAYATSTAGAAVTYTPPTATDAIDGVRPVTCTPASGSTFAINKTTVTCTASDVAGNTATATFTVWVQYQTGAFLAPLLPDGSAIIQRSRVSLDVAFPLTGASAPITNLSTARLTIAPVVNGVAGTFVAATPASGSGNLFTYDSVGKRYVFKMALGGLADGTFRLHAELNDGITREVNFSTVMSWAPLTLAADWTGGSYSTALPASALLDGVVYLRGAMSGTGSGRPFQMPVGQRPTAAVTLPVGLCGSVKGTLQIEADGWAYLFGDASAMSCFVSFEGLSYVVNNGTNTALTLQTGWTTAGAPWRNPTATISSDVVHLAGAITGDGTMAIAFTLPANMRPAANVYVPINLCTPRKGRLLISATGTVEVYAETGSLAGCSTSLEGVTFPVANTAANGWTCLTPTNGWTAMPYSTRNTCVKNVDGVIRLSGSVQTGGTDMNALTLPVGLRPSKESYVLIDLCGATTGRILVSPSGNVNVQYETSIANAQCFASFEGAAFSL